MDINSEKDQVQAFVDKGNYHAAIKYRHFCYE